MRVYVHFWVNHLSRKPDLRNEILDLPIEEPGEALAFLFDEIEVKHPELSVDQLGEGIMGYGILEVKLDDGTVIWEAKTEDKRSLQEAVADYFSSVSVHTT